MRNYIITILAVSALLISPKGYSGEKKHTAKQQRAKQNAQLDKEAAERQARIDALFKEIAQIKADVNTIQENLNKSNNTVQAQQPKDTSKMCHDTSKLCYVDLGIAKIYMKPSRDQAGGPAYSVTKTELKNLPKIRRLCTKESKECDLPLGVANIKLIPVANAKGIEYNIKGVDLDAGVKNIAKDISGAASRAAHAVTNATTNSADYLNELELRRVTNADGTGSIAYDIYRHNAIENKVEVKNAITEVPKAYLQMPTVDGDLDNRQPAF